MKAPRHPAGEPLQRRRGLRDDRRPALPYRLFVPALAVAAALAFWWTRDDGGGAPAGFPWLPDASPLLVTPDGGGDGGGPDAGDAKLREGLSAYARRDPAAAIEALGRANATGAFESARRVYLGSALAHVGRRGEAAAILERTPLASMPEPWRSDGTWTLAVLWRDAGDARADSLLSWLAEGEGPHAKHARAAMRER